MSHPDDRSGHTKPSLASIGIIGEAHAVGRIQRLESALAAKDRAMRAAQDAVIACNEELSECRRALPDTPEFDFLAGKTLLECIEALVAGVPYAVALHVALKRYGYHEDQCESLFLEPNVCSCGFDAALAKNPIDPAQRTDAIGVAPHLGSGQSGVGVNEGSTPSGSAQNDALTVADPECICRGNWRAIVKRVEPLIGKQFLEERNGKVWRFFGVVHGDDDYYYGMSRPGELCLASCVGSLEGNGYTLIEPDSARTVDVPK